MGAPQRRPALAARPGARRARGFDAVIARAMAKDPDDRFPSAGDLGRAALAAAGRPVAPSPSAWSRSAPPRRATARRPSSRPTRRRPSSRRSARARAGRRRGPSPWCRRRRGADRGARPRGRRERRRRRDDGEVDRYQHDHEPRRGDQDRGHRRAAERHRPGQRQGVGRAQRQSSAGGDRRQDRQACALQPARGQPERRGRRLRQAVGHQPGCAVAGADRAEVAPPGGEGCPAAGSGQGRGGRRGDQLDVGRRPRQPGAAPADRPQQPRQPAKTIELHDGLQNIAVGGGAVGSSRGARTPSRAWTSPAAPSARSSSARSRSGSPTAAARCG